MPTHYLSVWDKIRESNRIERIYRDPTIQEVEEFHRFIALKEVTVNDLEKFVSIYAPGNVLREHFGQDVRIGNYFPPRGSPIFRSHLGALCLRANEDGGNPSRAWDIHIEYEKFHPFTDGNGRSGRMLWYWMMKQDDYMSGLGFLHAFYYQTLRKNQ